MQSVCISARPLALNRTRGFSETACKGAVVRGFAPASVVRVSARRSLPTDARRGVSVTVRASAKPTSIRRSASPSRPKSDDWLIRLLNTEIQAAQTTDDYTEDTPDFSPFQLEDQHGYLSLVLRRKYGNEDIKVEVLPMERDFGEDQSKLAEASFTKGDGEEEDEDEEAEEGQEGEDDEGDEDEDGYGAEVNLTVTISKPTVPSLEFFCVGTSEDIMIEMVTVKREQPDGSSNLIPYEGPSFMDLDEDLKQGFHKFLQARGITPDFAVNAFQLLMQKDEREYVNWLQDIRAFVQSP